MPVVTRALQWVFYVWLVVITGRYAATTWKTLQHPFNPGSDVAWFEGWIAVCGLVLLGALLLTPKNLTRLILTFCAVSAVVIVTLSQTWVPFAVALWIALVCIGIGQFALGALRMIPIGIAENLSLSLPLGMAAVALVVLALGLADALDTRLMTWCLVAVTGFLAFWNFSRRASFSVPACSHSRETSLLTALVALSALLNLTWAVSPEIQFDALNYHLAMPRIYLQAHGLVDIRFLHAYLSRLLELTFVPGLALAGPIAVKLFVYGLGIGAAVATYGLGARLFNARVGIWGAVLVYTTPVVAWETGTAYVDNILALFTAAGVLAFVKWYEQRQAPWFYGTALIAGLAVGSKLNAAFPFVVLLAVMAISLRREWSVLAKGAFLFAALALPTYLVTWKFTGNPIFPLLNGVFRSPLWPETNAIFNAAEFGMPKTLSNLAVFPFRLTLDSIRFGEAMPRGALGTSLLLGFPFAVYFLARSGRAVATVVVAAAASLVALFLTMQYARYYVAILPLVAVIGAATALKAVRREGEWFSNRLVQGCLLIGIVVQFPALTTQYWNIPERFPVRVALGLESRDSFLRRALDGYAAADHINSITAPEDRILGVDVENLRFYLDAPLETAPLALLDRRIRKLSSLQPDAELAEAIRQAGFTVLFTRNAQLEHSPPGYPYLDKSFIEAFATPEFADTGTSVYRFRR